MRLIGVFLKIKSLFLQMSKREQAHGVEKPKVGDELRRLMSVDTALFYAQEVEKRLNDVHERTRRAIGRAHDMLRLTLTISTAVVAWIATKGDAAAWVAGALCALIFGLLLWRGVGIHDHWGAGSSLPELTIDELLPYYRNSCGLKDNQTYKELLCDKIEWMQTDIEGEERVLQRLLGTHRIVVRVYALGFLLVLSLEGLQF